MDKLLVEKEHKLFIKYLIPAVTGTLSIGILIFIDTVFIGRGIGAQGLAALNVAIPAFTFYSCVGYLLGMGGATVAAIDEGKGLVENKNRIFMTSFIIGIIATIFLVGIQNIYLDELVTLLGAKGDIFPLAKEYLRIIVNAAGLYLIPHLLNAFIRNDKNPMLTMIGMITCGVVNLTLDYVFIFIFGWGMAGAALATSIAQFSYMMILFTHFFKKDRTLHFVKPKFIIEDVKRVVTVGLPSFINELSSGLSIFLFNLFLFKLGGDLSVAAFSIILNINFLVYLVYLGVAQALQPLVSYNFGSGKIERMKKFLKLGLGTNIVFGIFVLIVLFFGRNEIILLFNTNNEVLRNLTSENIMKFFSATIFMGINIVFATYVQAKGQGQISSIIMLSRAFVLIVVGVFLLSKFIGVDGVWYATLFAESLTFIGLMIWLKNIGKKQKLSHN